MCGSYLSVGVLFVIKDSGATWHFARVQIQVSSNHWPIKNVNNAVNQSEQRNVLPMLSTEDFHEFGLGFHHVNGMVALQC